jgi:hypothetical protein
MPCNLKAALVPTAGAHCNITDICLAAATPGNRSEMNLRNAATSVRAVFLRFLGITLI